MKLEAKKTHQIQIHKKSISQLMNAPPFHSPLKIVSHNKNISTSNFSHHSFFLSQRTGEKLKKTKHNYSFIRKNVISVNALTRHFQKAIK